MKPLRHSVHEEYDLFQDFFATVRSALSGALIGVALIGIVAQFPYHEMVGALLGFIATLIAKIKHVF